MKNTPTEIKELNVILRKEKKSIIKTRRLIFFKSVAWLVGILSFCVLIGLGFSRNFEKESIGYEQIAYQLHPVFEFLVTLSFAFLSGALPTILKFTSKSDVKKITTRELIKDIYLSKLNQSQLNPQNNKL